MADIKRVPDGFNTLTPYLVVDGAAAAIELYQKALGAKVVSVTKMPGSETIMNAQLRIGDSMLMLNDEFPDYGAVGPNKIGGSAVTTHIYTDDIDALFQRAVDAGFEVTMPLGDQFWGDRFGALKDRFGHKWSMGMKISEPTEAEMQSAMAESFK